MSPGRIGFYVVVDVTGSPASPPVSLELVGVGARIGHAALSDIQEAFETLTFAPERPLKAVVHLSGDLEEGQ